jgi:prepilin-type N-terminal cleavage/methylation domain-containing protein
MKHRVATSHRVATLFRVDTIYRVAANHSAPAARGFTLIELLVVIGIIGLLTVALLPQIARFFQTGKDTATMARIQMLQQMIAKYEQRYGDFPPSDYAMAKKGVQVKADSVNAGIECLVVHLGQKSLGANLSFDDKREWLANTDKDQGPEIPELRSTEKFEVVDAWGTPLAYFHNASYGIKQSIMLPDLEDLGAETISAAAMKDEHGYVNRSKYQILSAGADLVFGTNDDICYPKRIAAGGKAGSDPQDK